MEDIQSLHKVDLEIVKNVILICEKYHLQYFMLGGTMLGAIRHKGFIPWDDDIDLGMPRKDYEKFLEIAKDELPEYLNVVNYKNTPNYQYYITRIQDTNVKVIEERIGNDAKFTYASIDIFPLDGSPNNTLMRKVFFFRVLFHRALMSLCYKDSIDRKRRRSFLEKILLAILEVTPIEKLTTPFIQKEKIDQLLKKYDFDKSEFVGNIMGAYRTKEVVPRTWYGKGKKYQFEDIELVGIEKFQDYLTHTYGDYMRLPPVEDRKVHYKIDR